MPTLSDALRRRLEDEADRREAEGDLLSPEALAGYYRRFAEAFGPAVLAALDGPELLERIHAHGRQDSLVYWLEFKDDEEFPGTRFGSIAGGSSLKFGIYRRRETGEWTTGTSQEQRTVPLADAIAIARRHRDQLISAAEFLKSWKSPTNDDAEYADLQHRLKALAPDVQDTAWGHKYLHLLSPDKLDDFHVAAYQRFHLIKLGQVPPVTSGRYASAGRFIALAAALGWPVYRLTAVLNTLQGRPYRYWRIGTSDGSEPRKYWPLMREKGVVAIGWSGVGDLATVATGSDARERVRQRLEHAHPSTPQAIGRNAQQLMNFYAGIQEGDAVVAADGQTILGLGRVVGPYQYVPDDDFSHQRRVEWRALEEWKLPEAEGLQSTVRELKKSPLNLVEIERRLTAAPSATLPPHSQPPVADLVPPAGIVSHIEKALDRKGQLILYGPPGTGKTFWAEKAARELAARHAFRRAFDDLSAEERERVIASTGRGFVRMCTFHPSYGYEDFLEGHRPETIDGHLTFHLRDGVFKRLCDDARGHPDERYYLLIDEINRGDVPRIFGELLTILERSKRGWPMILPLSGAVSILGTRTTVPQHRRQSVENPFRLEQISTAISEADRVALEKIATSESGLYAWGVGRR